jgi:hypothetical protein
MMRATCGCCNAFVPIWKLRVTEDYRGPAKRDMGSQQGCNWPFPNTQDTIVFQFVLVLLFLLLLF